MQINVAFLMAFLWSVSTGKGSRLGLSSCLQTCPTCRGSKWPTGFIPNVQSSLSREHTDHPAVPFLPASNVFLLAMFAVFTSIAFLLRWNSWEQSKAGLCTTTACYCLAFLFLPRVWSNWHTVLQLWTEACFAGYWELGLGGRTVHTVHSI